MTRKRRSYTDEFKRDAVKLVADQGYTVAEAARSLGVHANVLRKWKQKFEAESSAGANGSLNGEEREELRRLREEVRRLRMEREILKKAAAFFANENH